MELLDGDISSEVALGAADAAVSTKELLKTIRVAALNFLARREHSRVELARKLLRRFGEHQLVEQVLNRLVDEKLQSDERFTEAYVYHRLKAGFGPLRIIVELRDKGVDSYCAESHIWRSSHDWHAVATEARIKKFGRSEVTDLPVRAKQTRFLQYRGFMQEHIDKAFAAD